MLEYELPHHLIAQTPCHPRDHSRLLVVHPITGLLEHARFFQLPELLRPGDLLVLNNTRVLPARLYGHRQATGGKWEGLFLKTLGEGAWEVLGHARGTLRAGEILTIDGGKLTLTLMEKMPGGSWRVQPSLTGSASDILETAGHFPLPPYIRKGVEGPQDRERYQTVYAQEAGAVAAPTAGLHFTRELLDRLKEKGIAWTTVTLHVGLGTFQPMQSEDVSKHRMHREWGKITSDTVEKIMKCRAEKGRVFAVGTTSVRVLQTASQSGVLQPWEGETDLFIFPPYQFRAIDGLITNFHIPKSTLLLLVESFLGKELLEKTYQTALKEEYRFFSFGDAMMVLPKI